MADDVTLPGTGVVVAADDVASKFYQKIKLFASSDADARRLDNDRDAVAGATDPGVMMLGIRADVAASQAGTDGDYTCSIFDSLGRMYTNVGWGAGTNVSDSLTTSADNVVFTNTNAAYKTFHVDLNGTHAGFTINFEASWDGGTTYRYVNAIRAPNATSFKFGHTFALTSDLSADFNCEAPGATHFKVRSSARTSGTIDVVISGSAAPLDWLSLLAKQAVITGTGGFDAGLLGLAIRRDTVVADAANLGYITLSTDNLGQLRVAIPNSATPGQTSVGDSASSVTVLAANVARKGATVFNDSTALLYLKLGATASTTSFTLKMSPDAYYEVPFGYTGVIDGIWASDAGGNARITELA